MGPKEVNGADPKNSGYTPVRVTSKDSGESFIINFTNAKIKGNKAEWTIKDGKVYDKDGKTIEDNVLEVTRYQAALIRAAAQGNMDGDNYLDSEDLIGAGFAFKANRELQKAKSEYKLYGTGSKDLYDCDADAGEHGVISAYVVNSKGEEGGITIDIRSEEEIQRQNKQIQKNNETGGIFTRIWNYIKSKF